MQINLPDYKKFASEIKRNPIFVQEKEIEDVFSWLQRSRAKFIFENRPAQKGDFVEIEYWSTKIEGGARKKDAFILGEGHFIPGFEEKLEGMKPGEENHFLNFKVRIVSVQKMELAEINDEFARSLGNFENLKALRESIREGLYLEKEIEESQRIRQEILKKIVQNSEVEIPEILISSEQQKMMEILRQNVSQILKISFQDYLTKIKSSEEELLKSFLPQAKERVKNLIILKAIAQKENIDASEEEIKEAINKQIKYLDPQKVQGLDTGLDLNQLKEYTKEVIRQEKTFQFLETFVQ